MYCREQGFLERRANTLLTAALSVKGRNTYQQVFSRVIDNGKMLRNFVQILQQPGLVGRKSLGTRPKLLSPEMAEHCEWEQFLDRRGSRNNTFSSLMW